MIPTLTEQILLTLRATDAKKLLDKAREEGNEIQESLAEEAMNAALQDLHGHYSENE